MKKSLRLISIITMTMILIITCYSCVFAVDASGIVDDIHNGIKVDKVDSSKLVTLAGKVVGLIQIASVVAAVILVAVFGFKFILGSAQEKSDYQKSFIPLIVGVVVVFSATSIAKLLFSVIN